jgi:enoyl-CoA hydratase/carnithine racemase
MEFSEMAAVATSEHVGFDVHAGVARLQLLRPEKRNAVTADMWRAVIGHLADSAQDPDVRVLVVQGSGGAFCAGADLATVKESDGSTAIPYRHLAIEGIEAVAAFPVPTLAQIEGACVGAGCSLALACDVRFVDLHARFSIPAVRHGIIYDQASITRLVTLIGPSRAARMLYAAHTVGARSAVEIGLADECSEDPDTAVAGFIEAVIQGDPATIHTTRAMVRASATSS